MMFQFEKIAHSSPVRLNVQRLIFSYVEKSKASYWELARHKDKWYAIYDDGRFCGCAIPLSLHKELYTICIFNNARYCSAELRPAIIGAADMDYRSEWIDMEWVKPEQVKNL